MNAYSVQSSLFVYSREVGGSAMCYTGCDESCHDVVDCLLPALSDLSMRMYGAINIPFKVKKARTRHGVTHEK